MICPPGGTVLDPFAGSGSTGAACVDDGFHFIGIEKDADYCEIARRRVAYWAQPMHLRANGKVERARNTYGFKSTELVRRCPEHNEPKPSGSTTYKCGCPLVYEKRQQASGPPVERALSSQQPTSEFKGTLF